MNEEPHGLCHISEVLDYILNLRDEDRHPNGAG